ncbi:hypothetical protein JOC36_000948 [Weissella uvarum]|uniref:hypothetical protein n=1 Tax=Weissella uvarum TaxID=1479233 RepID=UPI00195FB9B4|nr:hypothetical protein [Weissella uvarum]MBM7617391.1 hypothetical protein [Weissella uvarum]MCM0595724.1 hypothetical protein [Weissella uvarum]
MSNYIKGDLLKFKNSSIIYNSFLIIVISIITSFLWFSGITTTSNVNLAKTIINNWTIFWNPILITLLIYGRKQQEYNAGKYTNYICIDKSKSVTSFNTSTLIIYFVLLAVMLVLSALLTSINGNMSLQLICQIFILPGILIFFYTAWQIPLFTFIFHKVNTIEIFIVTIANILISIMFTGTFLEHVYPWTYSMTEIGNVAGISINGLTKVSSYTGLPIFIVVTLILIIVSWNFRVLKGKRK